MKFTLVSAATLAIASTALAVEAPAHLNLANSFADTKQILASGGQADIVVLGDSLSFNPGTYLPVFRNLMQNAYGNAGGGYQGFSIFSGAGLNNGWLRTGINTDNPPFSGLDGLWSNYDGSTGFPNTAVSHVVDKNVQIFYRQGANQGSFQLVSPNGSVNYGSFSASGPIGVGVINHTVSQSDTQYGIIPNANGPFTILGHNSTRPDPGVRVHRAANGGWGVPNFLSRDFTFDQELNLLSTDLVMVWLGQNDQAYSRENYRSAVNQLVTRVQTAAPGAEVVLIGTYDQGSHLLSQLVEGMADVAAERGVGFINLYDTAGSSELLNDAGYIDAGGVHFTPAGGEYFGNLLFNAFQTNGASLVPEPGLISLGAIGALALLRRRRD